jgi:molybdopterin synthase sulfur carrier subunit
MVVQVRLFATLRENRFKRKELEFPEGSRLADLLSSLGISKSQIGVMLINGRAASAEHELALGDVVSIFPSIGGG